MFSPKVSDLWTENRFFLILFSRREWVGNPNQSIFPVPVVQLSPNFLHMVLNSLPRYHAKNFLIVSPFVYFLVYALIKIPPLVEIPSWTGRRELPIVLMQKIHFSLPSKILTLFFTQEIQWNSFTLLNAKINEKFFKKQYFLLLFVN